MKISVINEAIDKYYNAIEMERVKYYLPPVVETYGMMNGAWNFLFTLSNVAGYFFSMMKENIITTVWKEPAPIPFLRAWYDLELNLDKKDREFTPQELLTLFTDFYLASMPERTPEGAETETVPVPVKDYFAEFRQQVKDALGGTEAVEELMLLKANSTLTLKEFRRVVGRQYNNPSSVPTRNILQLDSYSPAAADEFILDIEVDTEAADLPPHIQSMEEKIEVEKIEVEQVVDTQLLTKAGLSEPLLDGTESGEDDELIIVSPQSDSISLVYQTAPKQYKVKVFSTPTDPTKPEEQQALTKEDPEEDDRFYVSFGNV